MVGIALKDANGGTINTTSTPAVDATQTRVVNTEGAKATYRASTGSVSMTAASATDVFEIKGGAGKKVKVTKIEFSGYATSAATQIVNLIKRSTANTAGTAVTATNVPCDSTDVAAVATVKHYTANPTTGTSAGNVASALIQLGTATAAGTNLVYTFGKDNGKAITLKDATESLCISLASASNSGLASCATVEWTEE